MSSGDWQFIDPKDALDARHDPSPRPPVQAAGNESHRKPVTASEAASEAEKPRSVAFVAREPLYSLSNLVLDGKTALRLQSLKNRFATHSLVYGEWGLGELDPSGRHIAFNLYGPPGTGKTMCVEALAREWGKKIIDVSYAEIESKYVGETGKNIVAAFKSAKEQDALLFFDGIVAFATNLARNFDNAFVRRIPVHVEIPLPDEEGRRRILETILPDKVPFKALVDVAALAAKTPGLSGGDLKNVVVNAVSDLAAQPWRTMDSAAITAVFAGQAEATAAAKRDVGLPEPVVTEEDIPLENQ